MTDTSSHSHRLLLLCAAAVFLLAALYGLMGFFQAVMLFTGERALPNSNVWGSLFLLSGGMTIGCTVAALRRPGSGAYRRTITGFAGAMLLVSAASFWLVLRDFLEVDACLDRGGSFNYVRSVCDFIENHPAMSLFDWRGLFLTAGTIFGVPAALVATGYLSGRKHENAL